MRRGRIPDLLLAALLDGPGHGYELMDRLEKFSGGVWRPSPGSVYPLLQSFQDRGLVDGNELRGRKVFALTIAGREEADRRRVAAAVTDLSEEAQLSELHAEMLQLRTACNHFETTATDKQVTAAATIVRSARQAVYRLLAEQ